MNQKEVNSINIAEHLYLQLRGITHISISCEVFTLSKNIKYVCKHASSLILTCLEHYLRKFEGLIQVRILHRLLKLAAYIF